MSGEGFSGENVIEVEICIEGCERCGIGIVDVVDGLCSAVFMGGGNVAVCRFVEYFYARSHKGGHEVCLIDDDS